MKYKHIVLSNIETGAIHKALCSSYKGWKDYSKWEGHWKQFDNDVHKDPDTIGGSGFGTIIGERLVGFASWDPRQYPSHVIIGHNCVLPEYRNRGIGKYQITHALKKFQEMGFRSAKVSTSDDPFFSHARRMYVSCGFIQCEPNRDDEEGMIYYSMLLS